MSHKGPSGASVTYCNISCLSLIFSASDNFAYLRLVMLGKSALLVVLFYVYSFIFSSPEHEVLMVSYCDQSLSVVRRASSVVRRQQFALKANSS